MAVKMGESRVGRKEGVYTGGKGGKNRGANGCL
jgi:hypothetical protein